MRIVLIGTAHPYRGGLASYNERLAKQFVDEGEDVEIVTFSLQYPKLFFPGKTQFTDAPPPENLKITRMLSSIDPVSWYKTAKYVSALNPDLILFKYWHPSMSPCFGTVIRFIKRKLPETKVLSLFDNVVPHEGKPGYGLLTRYFTSCIDGGIVMSRSVGDELEEFRKEIPVLSNPHPLFDNYGEKIDREAALDKLQLPHDTSVILFFGFIRGYKGLDLLIKGFADKRLRNRKLKLIIAGEFYDDSKPYKKLIADNGLGGEIMLMDRFIAEDEVATLFSSANIVVQPYKSATQSGVTQIAYHFGKPMLVTNVGGLGEIVPNGKCGYVVEPDPKEIADALVDYFDNAREKTFSVNVEADKSKFGWDRLTKTIRICLEFSHDNVIRPMVHPNNNV